MCYKRTGLKIEPTGDEKGFYYEMITDTQMNITGYNPVHTLYDIEPMVTKHEINSY